MIRQGRNSDMESMEDSVSDMTAMEESASGAGLEAQR